MLTVNGKRPNQIFYGNRELHIVAVKEDSEELKYVWAKSYPLKINQVTGATITVSRELSPYEHATLGSLSNDDTLYWGDAIYVNVNTDKNYTFKSLKLNAQVYTDTFKQVTCYFDYTITAVVEEKPKQPVWNTIFEGSLETPHHTSSTAKTYDIEIPGLLATGDVRITGKLMKETNVTIEEFQNIEVPFGIAYNKIAQRFLSFSENTLTIQLQRPTPTLVNKSPYFIITKVEQFY